MWRYNGALLNSQTVRHRVSLERAYTLLSSGGDAQIIVANWGGDPSLKDAAVVDGDKVQIFLDVIRPGIID